MNILFEKFDYDNHIHQYAACSISGWSDSEPGVMLPICSQDMDDHPYGVLAFDEDCFEPLGYLAVKDLNKDEKTGQIGSLIVSPNHRGIGLASGLLDHLVKLSPIVLPEMERAFAYANTDSLPVFLSKGGKLEGLREPKPEKTNCVFEVNMTSAIHRARFSYAIELVKPLMEAQP